MECRQVIVTKRKFIHRGWGAAIVVVALLAAAPASSGPGSDSGDHVERDSARAAERAEEAAARAAEDAARAEARAQRDSLEAAERAAEVERRAAEDAVKAAEDAAKDAKDAAEEARKEADDAARAEAEAAEEGVDESAGAATLRDIAAPERPELDSEGYPVRAGEVVALDLSASTRAAALERGFAVIDTTRLAALDAEVTRLSAPRGMDSASALDLLRRLDPPGSFDFAHYYASQYARAGRVGRATMLPAASRKGRPPLRVGMIDTSVVTHPSLGGVSVHARRFVPDAGAASAHGTAVASILARDGATEILAADVFSGGGNRSYTSADAIVRALGWLSDARVPVINISLTGPRNLILDRLIARIGAIGHVIVAAAGNGGPTAPPAYPAALPNVVAVTAVDSAGRVYRHANQGSYIAVAARGVGIPAAAPGGGVALVTGTSFAAPHVAAILARCARQVSARNSSCVQSLLRTARDLGVPGRDPVYGVGVIG